MCLVMWGAVTKRTALAGSWESPCLNLFNIFFSAFLLVFNSGSIFIYLPGKAPRVRPGCFSLCAYKYPFYFAPYCILWNIADNLPAKTLTALRIENTALQSAPRSLWIHEHTAGGFRARFPCFIGLPLHIPTFKTWGRYWIRSPFFFLFKRSRIS